MTAGNFKYRPTILHDEPCQMVIHKGVVVGYIYQVSTSRWKAFAMWDGVKYANKFGYTYPSDRRFAAYRVAVCSPIFQFYKSAEKHMHELKREMGRLIKLVDPQNTL